MTAMSLDALARTRRRFTSVQTAGLVLAVLLVIGYTLFATGGEEPLAYDFWRNIWGFDRSVLAGASPYPAPLAEIVARDDLGVYPPFAPLLFMPLAFLPYTAAAAVWSLALVSALGLALWLVGLRDWRCYAWLLVSLPVLHGVVTLGNITVLLTVCLALAWRWRDRRLLAGIALGAALAVKPFLLPVIVWLLATRRYRAAAAAAVTAALAVAVSWAAIGFDGLLDYPRLTRAVANVYESQGVSTVAAALDVGLPAAAGRAFGTAIGLALLALAVCLARQRHGDVRAFALSIGAAIALSPVVWLNYVLLLAVPSAVRFPRLGPIWLLPLLFWISQGPWLFLVITALILTATTLRTDAVTGLTAITSGRLRPERIR